MPNQALNKLRHSPENYASALLEEKCTSLYGNLPSSIAVSLIIAIILSVAHWDIIGHAEVIVWMLILSGTLLTRLITWAFWSYTHHAYSNRLWIILFRIQVWLAGIAWGLSAWFLFSHDSAIHQALLAFSIAGVASGSLTSLTIDRFSAIGFVITTVFPLSLRLNMEPGSGAFYMLVMSLLFIFFVISSTNRAQRMAQDRILQNIALTNLANTLKNKQQIEDIIKSSQSIFIQDKNSAPALQYILQQILKLSDSTIGFIGKIDSDEQDKPFMKLLMYAGRGSAEREVRNYASTHLPPGGEFHNLDNLFGAAVISGKPVISNAPQRDLRSGGCPIGHPVLKTFIALPIYIDNEKVALLCLANNPAGYSDSDIDQLTPMLNTIAQLVQAISNEADHARDKAALMESVLSNKIILDNVSDGIITLNRQGKIESFNYAAETIFGYKREKIVHKNISILIAESEKGKFQAYLNQYLHMAKGNLIDKGREISGLRKNGETFPMELYLSTVMHNDEPLFIGVVRDNSEKNKVQARRKDITHELLKELALQQLILSRLRQPHLPVSATYQQEQSSTGEYTRDIYTLVNRYFFSENIRPKTTIHLIKKIRGISEPLSQVLQPVKLSLFAEERRGLLPIECDETLLEVSLYLLLDNLVNLELEQVSINVYEEKSMARIALEANLATTITPELVSMKVLSIHGHNGNNDKTIPALLALYNGRLILHKIADHQLVIHFEFPQTIPLQ